MYRLNIKNKYHLLIDTFSKASLIMTLFLRYKPL